MAIKCKFDFHRWKVSEDGMERICERCGINCADYFKRRKEQYWFRFLASLPSGWDFIKMTNNRWWHLAALSWGFTIGYCFALLTVGVLP